jgi:hypothetical protein
MDSPQRLVLRALLTGMGEAVRRNDESAGDRYHRRLRGIAPHFDTNPRVSDALERLFSANERWLAAKVAERYETDTLVLDHLERVMGLL